MLILKLKKRVFKVKDGEVSGLRIDRSHIYASEEMTTSSWCISGASRRRVWGGCDTFSFRGFGGLDEVLLGHPKVSEKFKVAAPGGLAGTSVTSLKALLVGHPG